MFSRSRNGKPNCSGLNDMVSHAACSRRRNRSADDDCAASMPRTCALRSKYPQILSDLSIDFGNSESRTSAFKRRLSRALGASFMRSRYSSIRASSSSLMAACGSTRDWLRKRKRSAPPTLRARRRRHSRLRGPRRRPARPLRNTGSQCLKRRPEIRKSTSNERLLPT